MKPIEFKGQTIVLQKPEDIINNKITSEALEIQIEKAYRRGFYYGILKAADWIDVLKGHGYFRLSEVSNILRDQEFHIRRWMYCTKRYELNFKNPKLKFISWFKIKKQIHERDASKCVVCGSSDDLEVHHIKSVKYGGLPEIENLETLCGNCHNFVHLYED